MVQKHHRRWRSRTLCLAIGGVLAAGNLWAQSAPLTLKQAFEAAWSRQPEAQSLTVRREAADARRQSADSWTAEPPALEVSAKTDQLNKNQGNREYVAGIALPLWLPGERSRTGALADAESKATASRALAAQLRTAAGVREGWWSWQRARIEHGLAQDRLNGARQLASDVARRVKAGDLARADQHQADGAAAAAEVVLAEANTALATATQQLRALIGMAPNSPNADVSATGEPAPAVPADFAALDPGIHQADETEEGPNLPKAPLNTLLGFDLETYQIPLDTLMPSKRIQDGVMSTRKYKQVVSSIHEIGLIEPLSVIQHDPAKPEFILLDGHLRVLALKDLGVHEAPCLIAKDDETYTYNHRINRLSTIQEHYMIRRAIDRGVSKERLARAFGVNLSSINRRINLLEGICPKAIARLQDKQFTPDVTRVLRNMKAARQVEAVELMVASNTITVAHADALLKATPPEQRTDFKPTERDKQRAPIEQIVKLEKEMSQVQTQYKDAEENYGSDLLNLVVAKGYLTKLLGNGAVKSYITRHEPEILEHFELVVNTVSMEEAVQQQLEADGEFEEPPEEEAPAQ